MKKKHKEFIGTSWAIDNKTSIYLITIAISLFGLMNYFSIPKEQFPEIVIPTVMVNTIYPGTSPADIENLVTSKIEKNIKSISGVKKVTSSSVQDFSAIVVEFNTGIVVSEAKQKVKDAVDKTKSDLPSNLPKDPNVMEVDFSEIPIMYLNISGNIDLDKLKKHAEALQDKIEALKEVTRVDIVGALDKEVQINVDMYKMQSANLTFGDIERAVAYENMTISGGSIDLQGMKRNIRVVGEFKDLEKMRNIIVKSSTGALLYLKDIADVKFGFKDQENFARFNGKNVITMNVIKKSGQNLLDASDQIKEIAKEYKETRLPSNVNLDISGDISRFTRNTLKELNNTIIIGFILVTIVLMFFMGLTNAFFVGLSVPLSMAIAYIVMPWIGFTMNMLVMFAFIFALGIVVDDAIVVIENTHRIFMKGRSKKLSITQAAKWAAGEVFIPILSGTLTTLAPFIPLAFWPGVVGKFMFFIPVTLIITLFASLIVAYIINPVFAVDFMKHDDENEQLSNKKIFTNGGFIAAAGVVLHLMNWPGLANFTLFVAFSYIMHNLYGFKFISKFEHNFIPKLLNRYETLLRKLMIARRPYYLVWGTVIMLFVTFAITIIAKPKVVFFPNNDPNSAIVYLKMPVGTDVRVTDSITKIVEKKVATVLGKDNPNVESIIANVAFGASENMFDRTSSSSHLGKVAVNFVEFATREPNFNSSECLDSIREAVKGIPGAEISVEKNKMGPPTGKPINIEISGEDIDEILATSKHLKKYLDSLQIPGIDELKTDFTSNKPEIRIDIDRERANHEGITIGQIGSELRTAVFGKEISKFKELEDQFPIQLRYNDDVRRKIDNLMDLRITFMDMTVGRLRSIPLSSLAQIKYENSYGGINRKNLKRMITLSSNVTTGYTANEVNARVIASLPNFKKSENVDIKLTGEREDQKESMEFMSRAMMLAVFLILTILITQFNSISRAVIIISEIFLSVIGVLLGFVMFDMSISVIMTGMGVIALAGIVIRNGILLVEFTDVLKIRGAKTREAIVGAGRSRITPILLTASATILGLIPLAIGFNIDFIGLLTEFKPHIHFGGDNAGFFGPLAWAIIFGLSFATFLTLLLVPAMYQIAHVMKLKQIRRKHYRKMKKRNKR